MENEETAMRALEAAPEDPLLLERRIRVERAKAHRSLTIRAKGEARIVQEEEGGGEEGGRWVVRWNGEGGEEREEVKVSCQRERERERDATFVSEKSQRNDFLSNTQKDIKAMMEEYGEVEDISVKIGWKGEDERGLDVRFAHVS